MNAAAFIKTFLAFSACAVLMIACSGTMRPLSVDGNRVTYSHYESRFEAARHAARAHCAARGLHARHEISDCELMISWSKGCLPTGTCENCESSFTCEELPPEPRREPVTDHLD